ncbi:MAG: hypothetical protein ACLVEJ_15475 [Parabacteroides sp.]
MRSCINLILLAGMNVMLANAQSLKPVSGDIIPFISSYEGTQVKNKTSLFFKRKRIYRQVAMRVGK